MIARDGKSSFRGRDWVNQQNDQMGEATSTSELTNTVNILNMHQQNIEYLEQELLNVFTTEGKSRDAQ